MSSSTLTGPYIAESWIHMQQQGHGLQSRKQDNQTKMLGEGGGRFTKSTASSRSRASITATTTTTTAAQQGGGNNASLTATGPATATTTTTTDDHHSQHNNNNHHPQLGTRKSIKELMQQFQDEDNGLTRNGIYEAFAQVENEQPPPAPATAATRRKSTAPSQSSFETTVRLRRKSTRNDEPVVVMANRTRGGAITSSSNNNNSNHNHNTTTTATANATGTPASKVHATASPRVRALSTKKSSDSVRSSGAGTTRRRQSSVMRRPSDTDDDEKTRKQGAVKTLESEREPGNAFRLADALRDTLVVERKLARQELGLGSEKASHANLKSPTTTTTAAATSRASNVRRASSKPNLVEQRRKSSAAPPSSSTSPDEQATSGARSRAELISDVKRRLSLGKEKMRDLEKTCQQQPQQNKTTTAREPRRRTLSSGSILRTGAKEDYRRRKSTAGPSTTAAAGGAGENSYMKPTIADRRRRSTTNVSQQSSHQQEEKEESLVMLATKRRSALASRASKDAQAGSRASSTSSGQGTPGSGDDNESSSAVAAAAAAARKSSLSTRRRMSRGSIHGNSAGETNASTRTRKKSIVAMDDSSINMRRQRRLSRTESLQAGVPTSPSLNAAKEWRKKNQDLSTMTVGRQAKNGSTTTRKRGKTLPGSLAEPPLVQSINLPPMKVEPIRVNIPTKQQQLQHQQQHQRSASPTRIPKPSRSSALAATPNTASGTSSEEESLSTTTTANKAASSTAGGTATTITTTRTKKSNPLAAMNMDRRASLKTPRITPASPRDNMSGGISSATASPRTRPIHTRRPSATSVRKLSLSIVNNKSGLYGSGGEDVSPSIGPVPSRTRKISTSSVGAPPTSRMYGASTNNSRKNSIASATEHESLVDKEVSIQRHRAMSLQERLQAMVRQHTEHTPIKDNYTTDMQYPFMRDRRARRSQTYEMDGGMLGGAAGVVADDESGGNGGGGTLRSPNRISDSLLWEKEMAEIAAAGIRGPKSPTTAIKYFSAYLSLYERNEIQEYGQIYFVGHQAQKHPATPDQPTCNYGYDDERGDYNIIVKDHLAYRYEVIDVLGRGSFGQVVKCFDHKTGMTVAIKLIRNKKRFHAQAQTEVKILKDLVDWDPQDQHHNVRMTDYFVFRNHLCIACECLSINLYEFIKNNNYRGVTLNLIKRFTVQLLQSLCLLYEHGVIHCDLKPENILLKHPAKSTIKVIDFGSSCFENDRVYTYIQSRFYRSPEVILGMNYNTAIDMWSLGCILAELYTGLPLFPGENEQEQLGCIMEILGVPNRYLIEQSSRRKLFFDSSGNPRIIPNSRGKKRRPGTKSLSHALRCHDAQFLDFIEKCLDWDPEKRMTPDEALCHEWILSRHSKSGQSPVCAEPPSTNDNVTKHLAVAHTEEQKAKAVM